MSKVFGMHTVALKPGVKAEDFEKFIADEVYPLPHWKVWKSICSKATEVIERVSICG